MVVVVTCIMSSFVTNLALNKGACSASSSTTSTSKTTSSESSTTWLTSIFKISTKKLIIIVVLRIRVRNTIRKNKLSSLSLRFTTNIVSKIDRSWLSYYSFLESLITRFLSEKLGFKLIQRDNLNFSIDRGPNCIELLIVLILENDYTYLSRLRLTERCH